MLTFAMSNASLELYVRNVIERAQVPQITEGDLVELKGKFVDPADSARQLAGACNAARGEPVLWLVGVQETPRGEVCGVDLSELSIWYNNVSARFDGRPPAMRNHPIGITDKTVLALLFDTSNAPFVVKNKQLESTHQKNDVRWEVPWREGTRTKTARREDLLRILVPAELTPDVEVLSMTLGAGSVQEEEHLLLIASLYMIPKSDRRVVMPIHRAKAGYKVQGEEGYVELQIEKISAGARELTPVQKRLGGDTRVPSLTVAESATETLLTGPGTISVRAAVSVKGATRFRHKHVEISIALEMTGGSRPVVVQATLGPTIDPAGSRRFKTNPSWTLMPQQSKLSVPG